MGKITGIGVGVGEKIVILDTVVGVSIKNVDVEVSEGGS